MFLSDFGAASAGMAAQPGYCNTGRMRLCEPGPWYDKIASGDGVEA